MATLVVVPCGASKVWKKHPNAGPTRAKDVYTGAPFKVNREYAEEFGDRWVILSGKYGFIDPELVIPADYNVTFNDPRTKPVSVDDLRRQILSDGLSQFDLVVSLGGTSYANAVRQAFNGSDVRIVAPAEGLPIGGRWARFAGLLTAGRRSAELRRELAQFREAY